MLFLVFIWPWATLNYPIKHKKLMDFNVLWQTEGVKISWAWFRVKLPLFKEKHIFFNFLHLSCLFFSTIFLVLIYAHVNCNKVNHFKCHKWYIFTLAGFDLWTIVTMVENLKKSTSGNDKTNAKNQTKLKLVCTSILKISLFSITILKQKPNFEFISMKPWKIFGIKTSLLFSSVVHPYIKSHLNRFRSGKTIYMRFISK